MTNVTLRTLDAWIHKVIIGQDVVWVGKEPCYRKENYYDDSVGFPIPAYTLDPKEAFWAATFVSLFREHVLGKRGDKYVVLNSKGKTIGESKEPAEAICQAIRFDYEFRQIKGDR